MKRLEELDFTRVLAMLAVIMIHVTSGFVYADSRFTLWGVNPAFFLNQLSRFAVPLFLLLSGLSLELGKQDVSPGAFYKRRLWKIGIPYLIWSLLYFFYNWYTGQSIWTLNNVISALLKGSAASHLYFIVALFQLYALYPLLQKLVRTYPVPCVAFSFCMSYAVQQSLAFADLGLDLIPGFLRPWLTVCFPTWIFYFVLGMALAGKPLDQLRSFARTHRGSIFLVTAVYVLVYIWEASLTGSIHSIKPQLNLFVPLALLFSLALWSVVGNWDWLRKLTALLSRCSMDVFYCHIFVLYLFRSIPFFSWGMGKMLLMYVGVTLCSVAFAWGMDRLKRSLEHLRLRG